MFPHIKVWSPQHPVLVPTVSDPVYLHLRLQHCPWLNDVLHVHAWKRGGHLTIKHTPVFFSIFVIVLYRYILKAARPAVFLPLFSFFQACICPTSLSSPFSFIPHIYLSSNVCKNEGRGEMWEVEWRSQLRAMLERSGRRLHSRFTRLEMLVLDEAEHIKHTALIYCSWIIRKLQAPFSEMDHNLQSARVDSGWGYILGVRVFTVRLKS